ncbi:hypothetical protein [Microbacterium aurum]
MAKLARIPRIWIAALAVAAAALTLAFVLLPGLVLGSPNAVPSSLAAGLSAFWDSGDGAMPPALVALIDYWREWHVIKVLLSGLLVAVSIWGVTLLVDGRYQEGTTGRDVYESQEVH